jgi:hypothetical protein
MAATKPPTDRADQSGCFANPVVRSMKSAMASRVVEIEQDEPGILDRMIRGNRQDMRIGRGERLAILRFQPPCLDLRDRFALVTFDQHQIARCKTCEDFRKARFRGAAQFVHDGVARARDDGHLMGAGLAMAKAVGTDLVDVEIMVGVLDRRDAVAAPGQFCDEPDRKAGLSGILPAGNAEDFWAERSGGVIFPSPRSAVASVRRFRGRPAC